MEADAVKGVRPDHLHPKNVIFTEGTKSTKLPDSEKKRKKIDPINEPWK